MIRKAFTLIELIIIMGILFITMTIFIPGFLRQNRQTELAETIAGLVSDIKSQQLKAMSGVIETGSIPHSYSLTMESNGYVLLPENFRINLAPEQEFAGITLPGSQITFAPGSGEVSNFVQPSYVFSIVDNENNLSYTLTINQYGAITQLD